MGRKILVIDDEPAVTEALKAALGSRGYEVVGENDPQVALSKVDDQVGLIFLDIRMPGVDGLELCRQLKRTERGRKIPVFFLTALDPMEKEWPALQAGAAGYLQKPVKLSRLLEVIVEQFGISDREADRILAEFKMKRDKPPPPSQGGT